MSQPGRGRPGGDDTSRWWRIQRQGFPRGGGPAVAREPREER